MKKIILVMTSVFLSLAVFADMQEGSGSCPDVDDGQRTRACVIGDVQSANKCIVQSDQKVDETTKKVIQK